MKKNIAIFISLAALLAILWGAYTWRKPCPPCPACPACTDCDKKPFLTISKVQAKPSATCPSIIEINSLIEGLNPATDNGRKVTVYYALYSFLDKEGTKVDSSRDVIIGFKCYVAGSSSVIDNTDVARRFVVNETDHDTRLERIKKGKEEGIIKKIMLRAILFQDNRPCPATDVHKDFDVTDSF